MEAITGEMLVAQARTWIDTPYHHAGRAKGHGVDCIGLVIGAARELGAAVPFDTTAYGRGDNLPLMQRGLLQFCDCLQPGELSAQKAGGPPLRPGDILIFRGGSILHHVAIYTGPEMGAMIHVYNTVGKVVEQRLTPEWVRLLHLVFRLRGGN